MNATSREEPAYGDWEPSTVRQLLTRLGMDPSAAGLLAVDGRSGGGKSTLAELVAASVDGARVVHTDDVAWHLSVFGWAEALIGGILEPWRRGEPVSFRPPGWVEKRRPGAIELPAGVPLLVIEGVGASQVRMVPELDAAIWVHSDAAIARERGIARDVASGANGSSWEQAARFWDEWMAEENPFLQSDRPWTRADAVVAGHAVIELGPGELAISPDAGVRRRDR